MSPLISNTAWSADRDALAAHIKSLLEGAEFNGQSVDEFQAFLLILQGQALLIRADLCAANLAACAN